MARYFHPQKDFYDKLKLPTPEATPHGTEEELAQLLEKLEPRNWRLEGNRLIAETDQGTLVNLIPTDRIMTGTDDEGLPIFKKIG